MGIQLAQTPAMNAFFAWSEASRTVGNGTDPRSSENGLLTIFYGSVEHAARFDWLNAGRTLVDKTYIDILRKARNIPEAGLSTLRVASDLDSFIRNHIEPVWDQIEHGDHDLRHQLAIDLTTAMAEEVFSSDQPQRSASWLMFYLCPQLPVFPMAAQLIAQILKEQPSGTLDYPLFHKLCRERYSRALPHIHSQPPASLYGNEKEREVIKAVLRSSDWWQRRCFIDYLS